MAAEKARRLFHIYDLLPWEDDVPGRTASELAKVVASAGFTCNKDTVARDLRELDRIARIESQQDGTQIRYKRFLEASLSDFLVEARNAA
jgi:arginine repressor